MPRPDAAQKLAASKPRQSSSRLPVIISSVIAVVVIAGIIAAVLVTRGGGNTSGVQGPASSIAGGKGVEAYPGKAAAGAPVVDIYEDFQCPICNEMEKANGTSINDLAKAGKIKLVYHMMSFLDNNLNNHGSTLAANAGFCAADVGKFPQFHSIAYANQKTEQQAQQGDTFNNAQMKGWGAQLGLSGADLTKYQSCVQDNTWSKYVTATQTAATKAGVTGTPTMFINGKNVTSDQTNFVALTQQQGSFPTVLASVTGK